MKLLQNIFLCILMSVFSFNAQSARTHDKFPDGNKSAAIMVRDNITGSFSLLIEYNNEKAYQQILAKSPFVCSKTEFVTKSYIRISCLEICTKRPKHRIFTYYNSPESGCLVTKIKFDDLTENYFMEN